MSDMDRVTYTECREALDSCNAAFQDLGLSATAVCEFVGGTASLVVIDRDGGRTEIDRGMTARQLRAAILMLERVTVNGDRINQGRVGR